MFVVSHKSTDLIWKMVATNIINHFVVNGLKTPLVWLLTTVSCCLCFLRLVEDSDESDSPPKKRSRKKKKKNKNRDR